MYLRLTILLCFVFNMLFSAYSAQVSDSTKASFKDRIALHTNAVGHVFITPNLGVEYSFIQNKYKKVSVVLYGKYNPNSYTKVDQRYLYNIGGARSEVRWYFRTRHITEGEMKLDSVESFWRKLTMRPHSFLGRKNPRLHRAYYIGPYLAFDKYTIKLTEKGYQGYAIGLGATAGYTIPLYKYRDGSSIDFELGFNLGIALSAHETFRYDSDEHCYMFTGKRGIHVSPFPVIADARVAFVYRFKSIRDQIVDVNIEKVERSGYIYDLMEKYKNGNAKFLAPGKLSPDSVKRLNEIINAKNKEIRELNKRALKYSEVDSTMLLTELGLYYDYIKIPEKMFYKYDEMLPNKDIESVAELQSEYLNSIIMANSGIQDETYGIKTVASVATQMHKTYGNFPNKDDLDAIRLIEYLVMVVPNINDFCISKHNDVYHECDTLDKSSVLSSKPLVVIPSTLNDGRVFKGTKNFVFGIDSITLKSDIGGELVSKNIDIEAENLYKRLMLEEILRKYEPKENAKKQVTTAKKSAKSKKKPAKQKKEKPAKQKKEKIKEIEEVAPTTEAAVKTETAVTVAEQEKTETTDTASTAEKQEKTENTETETNTK